WTRRDYAAAAEPAATILRRILLRPLKDTNMAGSSLAMYAGLLSSTNGVGPLSSYHFLAFPLLSFRVFFSKMSLYRRGEIPMNGSNSTFSGTSVSKVMESPWSFCDKLLG